MARPCFLPATPCRVFPLDCQWFRVCLCDPTFSYISSSLRYLRRELLSWLRNITKKECRQVSPSYDMSLSPSGKKRRKTCSITHMPWCSGLLTHPAPSLGILTQVSDLRVFHSSLFSTNNCCYLFSENDHKLDAPLPSCRLQPALVSMASRWFPGHHRFSCSHSACVCGVNFLSQGVIRSLCSEEHVMDPCHLGNQISLPPPNCQGCL